uniref:Tachykinin 2 n=1 Tax=Deroceras reticulatum TaxID=145610 RepID=A0A1X9WEG9_DERRE|nr:tachykinin 2 [Deroceras reticulatum]
MMIPVFVASTIILVLGTVCSARSTDPERTNLLQVSGCQPLLQDSDDAIFHLYPSRGEAPFVRQIGGLLALRDGWLDHASQLAGHVDRRFQPSGFLGSRGKRPNPSVVSLARYYQDASKRKRQPHTGFHGSRG